jgi:periplasmic divalent cation tolerance protein
MPVRTSTQPSIIVVLVTCPNRAAAERLARSVVEEGLAACVNVVPGLTSVYRWQGEVCQDREVLLILKTRRAVFSALARRIKSLHPYTVPEVIGIPVTMGAADYVAWVESSVTLPPAPGRRSPRKKATPGGR